MSVYQLKSQLVYNPCSKDFAMGVMPMDIQWVILGKSCKLYYDRTLDIGGIFHHKTIIGADNKVSFYLVAKANFNFLESNESKTLTIQIKHNKRGLLASYDMPYKIPDLATCVNRLTYLNIAMHNIRLSYSGDYTFAFLVDGEYKNEESIGVTNLLEEQNA